jgi:hypothetical protein
MKIGAAALIKTWGKTMSLSRNGTTLVETFKGKFFYHRPFEAPLDQSVDQFLVIIIACVDDFGGVFPLKFDSIYVGSDLYTVQLCHVAGADEDELYRIHVRGGQA